MESKRRDLQEAKRLGGGTLANMTGNSLERNKKNYSKATIIKTPSHWHMNRQSVRENTKSP